MRRNDEQEKNMYNALVMGKGFSIHPSNLIGSCVIVMGMFKGIGAPTRRSVKKVVQNIF